MEIISIEIKELPLLQQMARLIWTNNYREMISSDQIDYMLDTMYAEDQVKASIASGEFWCWLSNDGKKVGYIHFYPKEGKMFLSKIYLLNTEQGKGFAAKAVDYIVDFARNNQLGSIYLTVNKNNPKAIKFYEKYGFNCMEEKIFDIGNGYVMDDYIYEYPIKKPQQNAEANSY